MDDKLNDIYQRLDNIEKQISHQKKEIDLLYYLLMSPHSSSLSNPVNTVKKLKRDLFAKLSFWRKEIMHLTINLSESSGDLYYFYEKQLKTAEHEHQRYQGYIDTVEKIEQVIGKKQKDIEKRIFGISPQKHITLDLMYDEKK